MSELQQAAKQALADGLRRAMVEGGQPQADRRLNEETGGPHWDTAELQRDFEVLGFASPFVVVTRRSDGVKGSLEFTHSPRVYFNFREDES